MDLNLIKKLIKILESSDVTDLEIEENGTRVKLAKKVRVTQAVSYTQAAAAIPVTYQTLEAVSKTETKKVVLCIVEAMKLMNEIESDVSGKIVKILVENGKPVEYNQPLFLVQLS